MTLQMQSHDSLLEELRVVFGQKLPKGSSCQSLDEIPRDEFEDALSEETAMGNGSDSIRYFISRFFRNILDRPLPMVTIDWLTNYIIDYRERLFSPEERALLDRAYVMCVQVSIADGDYFSIDANDAIRSALAFGVPAEALIDLLSESTGTCASRFILALFPLWPPQHIDFGSASFLTKRQLDESEVRKLRAYLGSDVFINQLESDFFKSSDPESRQLVSNGIERAEMFREYGNQGI